MSKKCLICRKQAGMPVRHGASEEVVASFLELWYFDMTAIKMIAYKFLWNAYEILSFSFSLFCFPPFLIIWYFSFFFFFFRFFLSALPLFIPFSHLFFHLWCFFIFSFLFSWFIINYFLNPFFPLLLILNIFFLHSFILYLTEWEIISFIYSFSPSPFKCLQHPHRSDLYAKLKRLQ